MRQPIPVRELNDYQANDLRSHDAVFVVESPEVTEAQRALVQLAQKIDHPPFI
jgi:hypothetical protein